MATPLAARAAVSRFSAWGGIVFFFALAISGLFSVKWSPYYVKGFIAAQDHTLGASIVSGNLPASPEVGLQAGLDYSIAYMKAIWQALLLGLVLGGRNRGVTAPRAVEPAFFRPEGFAARDCLRHTLDDVHCCCGSDRSWHDREWSRRLFPRSSTGSPIQSSILPPSCSSASSLAGNGPRCD